MQCEHCRRELDLGADVFKVTPGVLGANGFVATGEEVLLCSEECFVEEFGRIDPNRLRRYLDRDRGDGAVARSRRIP